MDTRDEFTADQSHIKVCERCGVRYDWRRSPSGSLKMTYCGSLCERADLGFTLDAILRSERRTPVALNAATPNVPLAA
jgi:hypothetical protein